ncbi:FAD-binding protein [Cryobacterium sp. TMT2-18-3]|uniref:D-arabinono-1,4-lactone oxidase n=1 Tax=unclassified Cryobacterium TaxID=2649013 RepID=UPI00106AACAB|nr:MULTISPECIES: D-arabinono-1,4-lactone oxidase [unclassified Cryobacterium]TFC31658.1 FAD-binding protein [Cryobacterium sp. TMT2-18-2]TFC33533.1 FAD-binding protein [Cryobacterium sp. TMT2-42-4]TFC67679.1 FAD-binding protein [Cryobacterium sp. TMT2-18-3]
MSASGAVWRNWARNQAVTPVRVERPSSVAAVQRAVVAAGAVGLRVKAVGSGHSFSGIALAPGVQLDLFDLAGLIGVDTVAGQVTLAAGTRLFELPRLLRPYGLALPNLGDVDRQTISGATSTGTHGTGGRYGGLATQIVALTLVVGDGSLLRVSATENPELLPATRLGLGALGIVVDVTLQCVPAFLLHAVEAAEPLAEVLEHYLDRTDHSDHYEFFWFPHTETALTKTNTRLPLESGRSPLGKVARFVDDELLANGVYRGICALGAVAPATVPGFNRLAARLTGRREFTDVSHHVFLTNRTVRFQEMEYAVPRVRVPAALREVRALIEARGWRISFPIEVRSAAADDVWLSTAAGRETGYIAVHRYYREDPAAYFQAVEAIMRAHGGRPHWGKMHDQDAASLRTDYPHFDDFLSVRDRLDPERRFSNSYLERVLGR